MSVCHVLREDPDLADAVPLERRDLARDQCLAGVVHLPRGRWKPEGMSQEGIGLLVLEGLLLRRVGIDGRFGAELLGEGDILRPWEHEDRAGTIQHTTGWRVLVAVRAAALDAAAAQRLAAFPELTGRLVGRAVQRSSNLAINMAIVHQTRTNVRLHMLFWHLADRWGRVRPEGVILPLSLTHSVLADLVAARRPTVTSSLTELAHRGLIVPVDGGWLLSGEPPSELLELQDVAVPSGEIPRAS